MEKWSWVPVANTLDKNPGQLPAPALPTRCHQGAQSLPPVRAQEGKAGGPFQEGSGVPHALWLSLQHLSAARGSSGRGASMAGVQHREGQGTHGWHICLAWG